MENRPNISADLIWEIARNNNAFLVKRNSGGGVRFSRDPLNPTNKHSRKYAGFLNDKAVSVQPGEDGGVSMTTKKTKNHNRPAAHHNTVGWGKNSSNQKIYKGIANHTAKNSYRSDLRGETIARASAIKRSQQPKKDAPEKKLRGAKAKKAAEKDSA